MIERAGDGMVMLVGVQSNQFPRALDIAAPLRARAIKVCIGGFHVSGTISSLNGDDQDLDRTRAIGISLFAGEAEGRLEEVLRDAATGALKPLILIWTIFPASKARRSLLWRPSERGARRVR